MEIELKLSLKLNEISDARALLKRVSGASPKVESLHAIYYDTSSHSLFKKGYTLRVRKEGRHQVQTLKHSDPRRGDAMHRDEWSDPVDSANVDTSAGESGRQIRKRFGKVRIAPLFTVEVKRERFQHTTADGAEIEIALDIGRVSAGRRSTPIREIELELKSGPVAAVYNLALNVAEHLDVAVEPLSKGQHGFALIGAYKPDGVRLETPVFASSHTVADALAAAARRYFAQYLQNLPALREGLEDGVHQMRVAIRRLRSVLSAMRDYVPEADYKLVSGQLKTIQRTLSNTRDLDVLLARVREVPELPLRRTKAHRALVDTLTVRRRDALAQVRHTLESKAQTLTWLRVMLWFEGLVDKPADAPVHGKLADESPKILAKLLKRVRKRAKGFAGLSAEKQHGVRIACKKLRYGVDLFASLYKKRDIATFVHSLKVVQDELGMLNDAHMARHLLMNPPPSGQAALPAGEALGWIERDTKPTVKKAAKHLRKVMDTKPYW